MHFLNNWNSQPHLTYLLSRFTTKIYGYEINNSEVAKQKTGGGDTQLKVW